MNRIGRRTAYAIGDPGAGYRLAGARVAVGQPKSK
jgi:hypothetical protein